MDGIEFHQEDALHTSFADSEISAIETDLFLQFFPPDAKAELLKEWWRILKPGGIVTTRDFVQSTGGRFEKELRISSKERLQELFMFQSIPQLMTSFLNNLNKLGLM